jgi:hypothetical protein
VYLKFTFSQEVVIVVMVLVDREIMFKIIDQNLSEKLLFATIYSADQAFQPSLLGEIWDSVWASHIKQDLV